ncbi:hypothetical protein EJB05_50060 [Eragrostis curvula]|uniref:Uncharacterized protein n=1 Tax=Eragrostis curvula TaxID=38414 RepID=A0A5J9SZ62_9POAL|nr:hypothetical protein EJB05_50060 [Eragrostis curvula]
MPAPLHLTRAHTADPRQPKAQCSAWGSYFTGPVTRPIVDAWGSHASTVWMTSRLREDEVTEN